MCLVVFVFVKLSFFYQIFKVNGFACFTSNAGHLQRANMDADFVCVYVCVCMLHVGMKVHAFYYFRLAEITKPSLFFVFFFL